MENTSNGPPQPTAQDGDGDAALSQPRRESVASQDSQTARQYIDAQLQLEADALEALPYSFDSCTRPLGALRQTLFSCLTCNPPPSDPDSSDSYSPAGVCYSCSICCHGEHTLVELFAKRNFECDCGTSRLPATSPCTLRADEKTGVKGAVHSETPAPDNRYNQNFRSRFCGCGEVYDPHQEKGTMFQCLGLGTTETGGCGEDWWHPECLVGLPRNWDSAQQSETAGKEATDGAESKPEDNATGLLDEPPLPPGFPGEDDFETFVCYKCLESNPWLKRYAGSAGFLSPVYNRESPAYQGVDDGSKKRKFEDAPDDDEPEAKRTKEEEEEDSAEQLPAVSKEESNGAAPAQRHDTLPAQGPPGVFSLFLKEDFREHLCRCPDCFSNLAPHIQLREEEEVYEPPLSEAGDGDEDAAATGSQRSGSLLERGEAALSNVDRVRAIEGVMVYNHLKDKVKEFLKPYAESGEAVSADAIKGYFEKLRGDDQTNEGEQSAASGGGEDGEGDSRREQSGY